MILPAELSDLIAYDAHTLRVTSRESKRLEFKQAFVRANLPAYERTMAAFTNAQGGVIVFGVDNNPRVIIGTPAADIADEADITTLLRQDFAPELPFESKVYEVDGKTLFAIAVEPTLDRPVICTKTRNRSYMDPTGKKVTEPVIVEATIYYRYTARTSAIGYPELKALLDAREERRMTMLLETIEAVERVGVERAGVVDITTFGDANKSTNLYVSQETARSMNFIEEGRFTEKEDEGSPAYMVVGKVSLGEVVRAPLEDADKNLPSEAAGALADVVHEVCGNEVTLNQSGVLPLLKAFDLIELPYHEYDAKVKRRYITRQGIAALQDAIRAEPLRALQSFASKKTIEGYLVAHAAAAELPEA